jgi:hypothetical protein
MYCKIVGWKADLSKGLVLVMLASSSPSEPLFDEGEQNDADQCHYT